MLVNFLEVAGCGISRDIRENYFLTLKLAVLSVALTQFFCRPTVACDIISSCNVDTLWDYHAANLSVASYGIFPENRNQPLM